MSLSWYLQQCLGNSLRFLPARFRSPVVEAECSNFSRDKLEELWRQLPGDEDKADTMIPPPTFNILKKIPQYHFYLQLHGNTLSLYQLLIGTVFICFKFTLPLATPWWGEHQLELDCNTFSQIQWKRHKTLFSQWAGFFSSVLNTLPSLTTENIDANKISSNCRHSK